VPLFFKDIEQQCQYDADNNARHNGDIHPDVLTFITDIARKSEQGNNLRKQANNDEYNSCDDKQFTHP